jgi:hypothetical protein
MGGPKQRGFLMAEYLPDWMPAEFWMWPDADDTAVIMAAWTIERRLQPDKIEPPPDFGSVFRKHRDAGAVPGRFPQWFPPDSGAFRTWTVADGTAMTPELAEVDPVVNANVLFALGSARRLETPGVADAIRFINAMTARGGHRHMAESSLYYPDTFMAHYAVTRAWREGGVSALQPSVARMVRHVEELARHRADGSITWDRGHPALDTALAVLTLVNGGGSGRLVRGGIRGLLQMPPSVSRREKGPLFHGTTDSGILLTWHSRAASTALKLEALCRFLLTRQ